MKHIETGTQVKFRSQGRTYEGKVISARNWGEVNREGKITEDNWYIEVEYEHPDPTMTYGYWKQSIDGGELLEVGGESYKQS